MTADNHLSARNLRMPSLNLVMVAGRLTRAPELQDTPTGHVCNAAIAINRYSKKTNQESVMYVDVTFWNDVAKRICGECVKGSPMLVEGRLSVDTWNDKHTGAKRSKVFVTANRVSQLSWGEEADREVIGPIEDELPF